MPKFISDADMLKLESEVPKSKGFISDEDMNRLENSKPSELTSAARGVAQGASFGFADELAGGVEALWEKAKGNPKEFGELYSKARDESRSAYKKAEQANPTSFAAGQLGGAIGTALVPGLGGANIAKLGLMGAAQGIGSSEAEDLKGIAKDAAIGGGVGLVTGGLIKGISTAGKALSPKLINVAEDIATTSNPATANTTLKSFDTIPGKAYHILEGVETGLKKIGNIPEEVGAQKMSTMSGLTKTIEPLLNPFTSDIAQYEQMASKTLPQRFKDTARGAAKIIGTSAAVGLPLGSPVIGAGAGVAAVGGALKSKVAGNILGGVRKGIWNISDVVANNPEILGKYATPLLNAAARGGQSLAATDFILGQTDPEYQKIKQNIQGEE